MTKEELLLLPSGTTIYFRATEVKFISFSESTNELCFEIEDVRNTRIESNLGLIAPTTPSVEKVSKLFSELTDFYFRSEFGPKNPMIKQHLFNYWGRLISLSDNPDSSAYVDAKAGLMNYLYQLREVITKLHSITIGDDCFFAQQGLDKRRRFLSASFLGYYRWGIYVIQLFFSKSFIFNFLS